MLKFSFTNYREEIKFFIHPPRRFFYLIGCFKLNLIF